MTVKTLVDEWLRLDPNEKTRKEIQDLWDAGQTDELESRLLPPWKNGSWLFSYEWFRVPDPVYCPVPISLTDLIVIQASQGLCKYVIENVKDAASKGVVVGHDHRHNSDHWAKLTAAAFLQCGVKVYLHRGLVHTPLVPFSVKQLSAACGVMITASHNPKRDNGYKVYWENAVQIISPHDGGIAASILANLEPWSSSVDVINSSLCLDRTEEMKAAYFNTLVQLNSSPSLNASTKARFVNTSMHGVSDPFVTKAFELFGFPSSSLHKVEAQKDPDPEFPSVAFPNPEEKGALDLSIETANKMGIDYVLAQDPDSDRFSAAERGNSGGWTTFTGDQLGALFAHRVFQNHKKASRNLSKLAIIASTVSSKMVEKMGQVEGFKFVECLTGFKYIGNTALDLVKQGYDVPFGYEEAIGYMFGENIRDKDGVAATMVFAELIVALEAEGKTVKEHLDTLYARYGYFKTSNSYFVCTSPSMISDIFARIRSFPSAGSAGGPKRDHPYPETIASLRINSIIDLTTGYAWYANPPKEPNKLPRSGGEMIQFRASGNGFDIVFTLRTSGTEPKIKYYLEASTSSDRSGADSAAAVESLLSKVVQELGEVWLEAERRGLGKAK